MSYTEYLDIIVRNSRQLGLVDERIQRIRDNLEAISGRPLQAAVGGATTRPAPAPAQPPASTRSRAGTRISDALGADLNTLTQSVGRVIRETDQFTRRQGDRLEQRARRINAELQAEGAQFVRGQSALRQREALRPTRRLAAGGGGGAVPPRRPPSGGGGGAQPPRGGGSRGPSEADRLLITANQLDAAVRQFNGQLVKAQQVTAPLKADVQAIAQGWEEAGGNLQRSVPLATSYARRIRALNAQDAQIRQAANARGLGGPQRAVLRGRVRAVASDPLLPEEQRQSLADVARRGLREQGVALRSGNRVGAVQAVKQISLGLEQAQQTIAAAKRAEVRAAVPQQARTVANRAQRLGRQANEINIPRTTPLGQELFNQAATIAGEANRQQRALRQSAADGTATTQSVKALTRSLSELQSEFNALKTRAQPLQQAARDATRRAETSRRDEIRNAVSSPIRGGANFPGSPAFVRAEALRAERQTRAETRLAEQRRRESTRQQRQAETAAERQRRAEIRNAPSLPIGGSRSIEGSPAFVRAQEVRAEQQRREQDRLVARQRRDAERQRREAEQRAEQQRRAEIRNAVSSPVQGGENFAGSPAFIRRQQQDAERQRRQEAAAAAKSRREQEQQQKAQREGVSFGSFQKNIGRVFGGGGDTQDFESLALGAGFPLLFGGGPGSVAGGLLGSFVGKGFGGQILGGAIGQIVDDLIASTAKLGNALNTLTGDFDALREAGVRVSPQLQAQVTAQRQSGDLQGAADAIRRDVAIRTGDVNIINGTSGEGLKAATTSVNALSVAWNELRQTVGVGLSANAAPLITSLAAVLKVVNQVTAGLNVISASGGGAGKVLSLATGGASDLISSINSVSGDRIGKFYESVSSNINKATGEYQKQEAAIKAVNDELVLKNQFERNIGNKTTASLGLGGGEKAAADAEIARLQRIEDLRVRINELTAQGAADPEQVGRVNQQIALERKRFNENETQERIRAEFNIAEAQRSAFRERQDRERALARETEALIRREEDLGNAQIDQARQEFDLQRAIADFRIRTEDQIASKRADLARQELEIARIRGQISDSQLTSRFDQQIEAAPNDQAARILSAAKEEALARKDLERTIRDGRIETALRVDQIERSSRQEQRALENDRIALERQRDSVIRSRVSLERQTEDLKRDTADYQLNVARQIEDSALRAAAALQAAAAGLLQGLGGATGGGTLINGGNANAAVISDTLRRKLNLPDVAIAGLLGNLEYESPGLNPRTIEGGGQGTLDQAIRGKKGYGISQLTSPDRQQGLLRFAGGDLNKAAQVQTQAEYLVLELTRNYAGTLRKLRSVKTVAEAVQLVQDEFLRPDARVQNTPQRLANAQRFLSAPSAAPAPYTPNGGTFDGMFGRTGRMSLAAGYGMVDVRGGSRAAVRDDAIDIIRANSTRGIRTSIGGDTSGDVDASRLSGEQLAKAVERGIDRHASRVGKGTFAIDLIAPEGTRVGLPLSGISNRGGDTGVAGTTPRGNLALHLASLGTLPPIPVLPPPPGSSLPGVSVGTAPFDLKAQAERDKQLQRERQKANEDLKREELRRREEETLREVVGEQSVVRKREELTLATRIAAAGLQQSDTEQKLLELRIASTREQEILAETVAQLGSLTKEREEALAQGLANKREELAIAEGLLKIEKERQILSDLQATQKEIQNFAAGIDAGFGVGSQAAAAYGNVLSQGGTKEQAQAQADAVRTLTLLQQTVQDAQAIGGSIGDGIQNALIAAVTGGDIQQAFSAMFATIGNTLIQSALRPIEESITNAAFNLLRPNLTQENLDIAGNIAKQQEAVAAASLNAAGTQLGIAAFQLQSAAAQLAANNIVKSSFGGGGGLGGLVGSLFSGAGPVSGAFGGGGLSGDLITQAFSGGFNFFAGGGNPPIGAPSIVGEAGPEVSVARGLSTIVSNGRSADLMDTLKNPQARDSSSAAPGETSISYDGPVLNFDSTNYVKQDDVPRIVNQAVKQSHGYTRSRMRNSPAERRSFGMR